MIYVSKEVAANEGGQSGHPKLSRSDIWKGLVMKAENALPFVPGMAKCDVVERTAERAGPRHRFPRRGRARADHLYPEKKVVFVRESGNVDGFIVNEVLGGDDDLRLRFSFALQLVDAPSDSAEEREFREIMERDYLKAVDATLGAIRKMVSRSAAGKIGARRHEALVLRPVRQHRRDAPGRVRRGPGARRQGRGWQQPRYERTAGAKEGIGYFFSTIDGIKHHMVNVAESNGLTFLEANVEYLRKDGKTVTIPAVTVSGAKRRSGEIASHLFRRRAGLCLSRRKSTQKK